MTFSQWRHFFKANHHQRKVLREGIRLARTRARENKCYEKFVENVADLRRFTAIL